MSRTTIRLLKRQLIIGTTHNREIYEQIKDYCTCTFLANLYITNANGHNIREIRRKYSYHKTLPKLSENWCYRCYALLLATDRNSITRSKKTMVTLPLRSLTWTWENKHLRITTITKITDCAMLNKDGIMETQQALDHIPGVTNTSEMQALNEFITTQSEIVQCNQSSDKYYEYEPINDCMQLIEVTKGVGKGKQTKTTSTGKLSAPKTLRHTYIYIYI